MGALAEKSEAVQPLIIERDTTTDGRYHVQLFDAPAQTWRTYMVDTLVPKLRCMGSIATHTAEGELWPAVLEKAAAKHVGSYASLSGGYPAWALELFTGQKALIFKRHQGSWEEHEIVYPMVPARCEAKLRGTGTKLSKEEMHDRLCEVAKDHVMTAGCHEGRSGLVKDHAYSVLDARRVGDIRLMHIRNPHGTSQEWHGAWSDGAGEWESHVDVAEAVGYSAIEGDGAHWISFDDFMDNFTTVSMVRPQPEAVPKPSAVTAKLKARFGFVPQVGKAFFDTFFLCGALRAKCLVLNPNDVTSLPRETYPSAEPADPAALHLETNPQEAPMNGLIYGQEVRLRHVATGRRLHSHESTYPEGSQQQQVTCYGGKDDNDLWRVKAAHEAEAREGAVSDGDEIRLEHVATGRNLHSHYVESAVSKQHEVSCFGEDGVGDSNDNWRVVLEEGKKRFRLQHMGTAEGSDGPFLHSHNLQYPDWGFKQQEVTVYGGKDDNDFWIIDG